MALEGHARGLEFQSGGRWLDLGEFQVRIRCIVLYSRFLCMLSSLVPCFTMHPFSEFQLDLFFKFGLRPRGGVVPSKIGHSPPSLGRTTILVFHRFLPVPLFGLACIVVQGPSHSLMDIPLFGWFNHINTL